MAALDESNDLMAILDRAPLGLAEVAADGTIITGNHLARALLAESELAGCTLADFIHPDSEAAWQTLWRRFLAGESSVADTLQVRLSQGRTRYLRITPEAENNRRFVWLDDRSEQHALSSQLVRQAEPDRSLGHDLNNSLAVTVGYMDLIQETLEGRAWLGGETLAGLRAFLAEVQNGLDKAEALVNDRRRRQLASNAPDPATKKHVLVIDDEDAVLEYLRELLGDRYKVTTFASGAKALRYFETHASSIDLAVVDHLMPDMDGIGLATELCTRRADLPVILCSADPATIHAQAEGSLRIRHFLRKPLDITQLRRMVAELTPGV